METGEQMMEINGELQAKPVLILQWVQLEPLEALLVGGFLELIFWATH